MLKHYSYFMMLLILAAILIAPQTGVAAEQDIPAMYWFNKAAEEPDPQKKVECYQKSIESKPDFIEAHYNLGLAYLTLKENNEAVKSFELALTVSPNNLKKSLKRMIYNNLANTYRKLEKYAEAKNAYIESLKLTREKKKQAIIYNNLGQMCITENKFDEAIEYLNKGVELSPEDKNFFENGIKLAKDQKALYAEYQEGLQLANQKNYAEAATKIEKYLTKNPTDSEAQKELDRVRGVLENQNNVDDEQFKILFDRAVACINDKDWKQAIIYLKNAKKINPDDKKIDELLTKSQNEQRQQLIAQQNIDNLYYAGIEDLKTENYTDAMIKFEKVASLNPEYKDITAKIESTQKEIEKNNSKVAQNSDQNKNVYKADELQDILNKAILADRKFIQSLQDNNRQTSADIDSILVTDFYQKALDCMQKKDWLNASIFLEKIKLVNPNFKNVEFLSKQVQNNLTFSDFAGLQQFNQSGESKNSTFLIISVIAGLTLIPVGSLFFFSPTTRAKYYLLQKKYEKARKIYETALLKNPHNVKLYITLAHIYINENRVDEVSVKVFERAIKYNDNLKPQLEPIVAKYRLEKSKTVQTQGNLLTNSLRDELDRMG